MKQALMMVKIQTRSTEESLQSKKKILEDEASKEIKNKEQMKQAQNVLKNLMDHVDKDNKNRSEKIEGLRRVIHNKEDAVSRRLDRLQRQKDIVEKAADNQEQSEIKIRENLLVQKFWNSFLKRKMEKEMMANQSIEFAFQRIRTATGISDIQEIMKKFVSREQTYSQLLLLISDNEKNLAESKRKNKELIEKQAQSSIIVTDKKSSDNYNEIGKLQHSLDDLQSQYKKISLKHQGTHVILGQFNEWVAKIYSKVEKILSKTGLEDLFTTHQISLKSADSSQIMETLSTIINEAFKKVGFADASNYSIKSYAEGLKTNVEFQKMVRVKARAKSAHKSEDSQSRSNRAFDNDDNKADKEIKDMNIEIEEERRKIKESDQELIRQAKEEKSSVKKPKKKEEEKDKEDSPQK